MDRKRALPILHVQSKKPRKPLAHESLKTILEYMDPNKRIELANCCPEIKNIERVVPLHIDYLCIKNFEVTINETKYQIGSFRKYPEDVKMPKPHKENNEEVTCLKDFDKDSIIRTTDPNILSPGNIEIYYTDPRNHKEKTENCTVSVAIRCLRDNIHVTRVLSGRGRMFASRAAQIESKQRNQREVCQWMADLQAYLRKRDGLEPPFEPMIQFVVRSPQKKTILLHENNMKLYEAMNKMTNLLFGDRKSAMVVKLFEVETNVLRIPSGFNVQIRQLIVNKCYHPFELDRLSPIISPLSFPLDFIKTRGLESIHPMMTNLRELVITSHGIPMDIEKSRIPVIHFDNCVYDTEYPQLIKNVVAQWIKDGREIGTSFSMTLVYGLPDVSPVFDWLKMEYNGREDCEELIFLPLSHNSEIRLSFEGYEREEEVEEEEEIEEEEDSDEEEEEEEEDEDDYESDYEDEEEEEEDEEEGDDEREEKKENEKEKEIKQKVPPKPHKFDVYNHKFPYPSLSKVSEKTNLIKIEVVPN